MTREKKFSIQGLTRKTKFQNAAEIVLDQKLNRVFRQINKFILDDSSTNLHALRIAFRRFRYLLETFSGCIGKKVFNRVYLKARKLQDLLGESRDLDVLEIKLKNYRDEMKLLLPQLMFSRMNEEKLQQRQVIKKELIKFREDKDVNSFFRKSGRSEK